MNAETLAHATEPFFTTKGVGKGTGLGLSMIHGLARQLEGTFALSSEPGHGTAATLWLPVSVQADVAVVAEASSETTELGRSLKILADDDDPLILMNTSAFLEDMGHAVWEASSGSDALETPRARSDIDLLITDQAMLNMTGVQLARALAAEGLTLPIVLATGYGELPTDGDLAIVKLGKPFSQGALKAVINRAMSGMV